MKPVFFASSSEFRRWLAKNHASAPELWVGFWKAHTAKGGLTYEQAVEDSLCFGWIDGLVRRYDESAYMQRFTPRRPKSIWSAINIRKVEALQREGRMMPAGLKAFAARDPARSSVYSFENRHVALDAAFETRFQAKKRAWAFFQAQPPGYRRLTCFWVMSAKRADTRERRFAQLLADSARGLRVARVAGPPTKG